MSEVTSNPTGPDLTSVSDPDVRRAMRAMHQQFQDVISRQQMEIDALLEMIMEKHMGSLGEFKRHLMRLQQNGSRSERIHMAVESAAHPASPHPVAAPGARTPLR